MWAYIEDDHIFDSRLEVIRLKQRKLIVVLVVVVLGLQTIQTFDAEYVNSTITVKPEARIGHEMVLDPYY
ncbi:MAG: hypothetical protein ACFFEE_07340 [Candidatus Thorarchaeota archaeon]